MSEALPHLIAAKAHSDKKQYSRKHMLVSMMMRRDPDAFVVDSDDGKGIVGVTHLTTGFKVHVPKQILPPEMMKAANPLKALSNAWGAVKGYAKDPLQGTVNILNNNPRIEQATRQLSQYRLLDPRNRVNNMGWGATIGTPMGMLSGAATGDDTGERLRNSLIGGTLGAAGGLAGGRYLPRASQWALGRALTNVVDPHIYDGKMHGEFFREALKEHGVKGIANAIAKDQPLNSVPDARARFSLYRDFFGLKPYAGTENVFKQIGTQADGGKLVRHNIRDAGGLEDLKEIHKARRAGLTLVDETRPQRWMQRGQVHVPSGGSLGQFTVKPNGEFEDVWDFALHPNEKINDVTKLLRAMVTPFGTPTKTIGRTLNESQVMRGAKPSAATFAKIHPSFTEPVLNRATRGAGLNAKELREYVNQKLSRGEHDPIMNSIAQRAAGRPYNMLHDMARSEHVSPGDMRVLLGGTPRADQAVNRTPKWSAGDLTAMFSKRIPGANPREVDAAISNLSPVQSVALRKGLTKWTQSGRPAGGELGVLARVLGFAPDELPVLLG